MIKRIESGIAGRGLGFDYLFGIKRLASQFPIKGAVFTRADGSIKLVAEGEQEVLEMFAHELEKDSRSSSIENFYVKWSDPVESMGTFYVLAN